MIKSVDSSGSRSDFSSRFRVVNSILTLVALSTPNILCMAELDTHNVLGMF